MNLRKLLAVFGCVLALAACDGKPPVPKAAFASTDITGLSYGQALELTDHTGQRRTLADYKGKVVVVFFGFTHCPDVCPTSLGELAQAKALLGDQGSRLQGIFISVDPERDTPAIMREYMANFDPSFVALRGSSEQLAQLAQEYKVYFKKVEGKQPGSYTMDHSAASFIYDQKGRLRLYLRPGAGPQVLLDDLRLLLKAG